MSIVLLSVAAVVLMVLIGYAQSAKNNSQGNGLIIALAIFIVLIFVCKSIDVLSS